MPSSRSGSLFAVAAFGLWGAFPLYFRLLDRAGALEIVGQRIAWSLVVCVVLVLLLRKRQALWSVLTDRRLLVRVGIAAVVVCVNWLLYVYAVNSGQVVEASLGYFISPLVSVLLGVLFLGERLRRVQWAAAAVGAVAVLVLTVDYGHLPIIALSLAASFGVYGLVKNKVGSKVDALTGLAIETLLLLPVAVGVLVWLGAQGRVTFTEFGATHALLLMSLGVVTVVPLLMFSAAARRIPLSRIGLLQYLTPSLQLLCGLVFLGEDMPPARWAGFALVWLALAILSFDGVRSSRRASKVRRATALEPVGAA